MYVCLCIQSNTLMQIRKHDLLFLIFIICEVIIGVISLCGTTAAEILLSNLF